MAISSMLKTNPNPLPPLKQRRSSCDAALRCINRLHYRPSFQFSSVQVKTPQSFTNITSTSKRPIAKPPSSMLEAPQFLNPSVSQDNAVVNAVQKTVNWSRVVAYVVAMSLFLTLLIYSRQTALASSIGLRGGRSFPSISASSLMGLSLSFIYFMRFLLGKPSKLENNIFSIGHVMLFVADFVIQGKTITKLQVGLCVNGQGFQKDLNRIAKANDESDGWKYLLHETTNLLLRYKEHWISGYSSLNLERSWDEAKKDIEELSSKARSKYSVETLVNLEDTKRESIVSQEVDECTDTYIVMTIFVAPNRMQSTPNLPTIANRGDVEEALKMLKFVSEKIQVQGVNVFWTLKTENDIQSLADASRNSLDPTKFNCSYFTD